MRVCHRPQVAVNLRAGAQKRLDSNHLVMRSLQLFLPRAVGVDAENVRSLDAAPSLRRLLSRARATRLAQRDIDSALLQSFGVERQRDWPVAPFTWLADGGDPAHCFWLRSDPVHLRADRDALVLIDARHFDLAHDTAGRLVATLNAHFESDGLTFHAPAPERWYVGLRGTPDMTTYPLSDVAGHSVFPLLPSGVDAPVWHRRFNEIQMLLHEHPVNLVREDAGGLAINSVWFWGGGILPSAVHSERAGVWSDAPLAKGLAMVARIARAGVPADAGAWLGRASDGAHVLTLDTVLSDAESTWFAPLLRALKEHRLATVSVFIADGDHVLRYDVGTSDLWKFWRRATTMRH